VDEVAFVVQRYGPEVAGGSESLARALAVRFAGERDVTVYTTCARDYVTWRNELPEGESVDEGVRVRRFPVEEERDLEDFNRRSEELYARPRTREEELDWLRRQGPVAPGLVSALRADKSRFAAVVFFTYLYHPTYWGLQAAPERALLVPTTHDEPPLRFSIYDEVFARARAFAFLTPPEASLVRTRFDLGGRPAEVAGIGVDVPAAPDVGAFRARLSVPGRYVLYAGRIDAGKGCAEMIDHYARFRRRRPRAPDLLLIGRLAMPEPALPGVRYLGYLDEADKQAALAGAEVVLCPSPYESLSIVLLEGLAHGVPCLANARSPVLADHCVRSNAGLFYADAEEFGEALDLLVTDRALRAELGENGRRYVEAGYRWDVVLARYRRLMAAAGQ
jgi:glycosyltransferase involved in cell wall biosynthesis